jgi:hypothetical protein
LAKTRRLLPLGEGPIDRIEFIGVGDSAFDDILETAERIGDARGRQTEADREEIALMVEGLSITAFPKRLEKLPYLLPPANFGQFGY